MPSPNNRVKLRLKAATKRPSPKPNRLPKLICLTAAGFSVLPSVVSGVLACLECEYEPEPGPVLKEAEAAELGETSRCVTGREAERKGSERPRAHATAAGRARPARYQGRERVVVVLRRRWGEKDDENGRRGRRRNNVKKK